MIIKEDVTKEKLVECDHCSCVCISPSGVFYHNPTEYMLCSRCFKKFEEHYRVEDE